MLRIGAHEIDIVGTWKEISNKEFLNHELMLKGDFKNIKTFDDKDF